VRGKKKNEVQLVFEAHMDELRLSWTADFVFHSERKWQADWLLCRNGYRREALIECGGGAGFIEDMAKYNNAALAGYYVLRFTPGMIMNGEAKTFIAMFFGITPRFVITGKLNGKEYVQEAWASNGKKALEMVIVKEKAIRKALGAGEIIWEIEEDFT
jgi:hypothetical protein